MQRKGYTSVDQFVGKLKPYVKGTTAGKKVSDKPSAAARPAKQESKMLTYLVALLVVLVGILIIKANEYIHVCAVK